MNTLRRYPPELRERAVRLVLEHEAEYGSQWATIGSIAPKVGCTTETLWRWVRQAERDLGRRAGLSSTERERRSGVSPFDGKVTRHLMVRTISEQRR